MTSITGYGKNADIWAVGVTAYYLLCGCMPFDGSTYEILYHQVRYSIPNFDIFDCDVTVDFLMRCLEKNHMSRWSSREALNHPFIRG